MVSDEVINLSSVTESDGRLVSRQLDRILTSPQFKSAQQMRRFLTHVINKTLSGEGGQLKQYTIAVEALGHPENFDPDSNPSVRILGGRVRERLIDYYRNEGANDSLIISIPKGSYVPQVMKRQIEKKEPLSGDNIEESQGPKLGIFCFEDSSKSKEGNFLLNHISATIAKELSHFIFFFFYVQIPFLGETRSDLIGVKAKEEYNLDFTLFLFVQELPNNKYELVYRLWDNELEEVISSEIFDVFPGQPETERNNILNRIMAVVADFYQGKLHVNWGRKLLRNEASIPLKYQTLAFYRYYADNLGREAFQKSIKCCSDALERNSSDIIANVIFADYCRRDYAYNFNIIESPLERGKVCAETAVRLRPDSHEAHFVLGQVFFSIGEWERSSLEFNIARSLCKNHTIIEYGTGFHLCLMGRWDEGMALVEKAMSLTDSYPVWFHLIPFLNFYRKKKYKEALAEAKKISLPKLLYSPLLKCAAYGQLGKLDKSQMEMQTLLSDYPDFLETGKQTLIRFLGTEALAEDVWDGVLKGIKKSKKGWGVF